MIIQHRNNGNVVLSWARPQIKEVEVTGPQYIALRAAMTQEIISHHSKGGNLLRCGDCMNSTLFTLHHDGGRLIGVCILCRADNDLSAPTYNPN